MHKNVCTLKGADMIMCLFRQGYVYLACWQDSQLAGMVCRQNMVVNRRGETMSENQPQRVLLLLFPCLRRAIVSVPVISV